MSKRSSKQIVFISGLFISNACWDEWIAWFEMQGYSCIAPAWPFKEFSAEELRIRSLENPFTTVTLKSLIDHFTGIISRLPEKPILIGHSFGGLIVQLLLQKQIAVAGVVIHSFPLQHSFRFMLSAFKLLWNVRLYSLRKNNYLLTFKKWAFNIANVLDCDTQKSLYYKYAVPESKKIIRQLFKCLPGEKFNELKVPILFTAGSLDKIVPAKVNYINCRKYAKASSVVEYKEFKNHNHLVFGHDAGEKEARFILHWLDKIQRS